MDTDRFEAFNANPGRRKLLATLLALGTAGPAGSSIPTAAAKKKRKRCKKKKCPPIAPPQTCDGLCDASCPFCYQRNAASNLCAGTLTPSVPCIPCTSDTDCVGTDYPYCVTTQTILSTGEINELSCQGMPGLCGRPNAC